MLILAKNDQFRTSFGSDMCDFGSKSGKVQNGPSAHLSKTSKNTPETTFAQLFFGTPNAAIPILTIFRHFETRGKVKKHVFFDFSRLSPKPHFLTKTDSLANAKIMHFASTFHHSIQHIGFDILDGKGKRI